MAKVYLFGGHFNKTTFNVSSADLAHGCFDLAYEPEGPEFKIIGREAFVTNGVTEISYKRERYYPNEMCFDRFDLNLRAIETHFFIVGSTERAELDQINQKLIRYANRGVNFTASRVRVV